jgi:hypothetical protein
MCLRWEERALSLLQFLARKCGEHAAHSLATHRQHPALKSVLCTVKRNGASGCTKRRDTATGKSGEAARTKGVVVREGDVMLWVRAACYCCPSWITGATRHPKHPGLNCREQTRQPGLVPSTGSRCDDCRWTGIDTQPAVQVVVYEANEGEELLVACVEAIIRRLDAHIETSPRRRR